MENNLSIDEKSNKIFNFLSSNFKLLQERTKNTSLMLQITQSSKMFYDVEISVYSSKHKQTIKDTRFCFSIFDDLEEISNSFMYFINSFENNFLKE